MKYKVGDKVKTRKNLEYGRTYHSIENYERNSIVEPMKQLSNSRNYFTIKEIYDGQYRVVECGYSWVDIMFDGLYIENKISKLFEE